MKKLMILAIVSLFAMVSCMEETAIEQNPVEQKHELTQITFNLTANHPEDTVATKAVKTAWEDGDVIFVFFSGATAPMYLEMKHESGSWTFTSKNDLALAEGSTGTMRAVYLPFGSDVTVNADAGKYTFSRTDYTYYLTAMLTYTVTSAEVSGTFDMSWPEGFVQFSMPITDGTNTFFREGAGQYTLSDSHLTPTGIASIGADGTITQTTDKSLGDSMVGYYYGSGTDRCILFSGVLEESARNRETLYNFTFVNNMGTTVTYDDVTYFLSGRKVLHHTGYALYGSYARALKFPPISNQRWTVLIPDDYVTVGGVKWAKWNVGATSPEGFGDYFSWGAIYPQAKYESGDYQFSGITSDLDDVHDVAWQKFGSAWRMPTQSETARLAAYAKGTETIPSQGIYTTLNGINGWLINDDNYDTNHKQLFLPCSGYWGATLQSANSVGRYHTSTVSNTTKAFFLRMESGSIIQQAPGRNPRYYGYSVRPVKNEITSNQFTVDASGKKVVFAPGNLRLDGSEYSFDAPDAATVLPPSQAYVDINQYPDPPISTTDWNPRNFFYFGEMATLMGATGSGNNQVITGTLNVNGTDWRLLTYAEWLYLIRRPGNLCAWCTISGNTGLLIAPDGHAALTGSETTIPDGCVFLPAGGSVVYGDTNTLFEYGTAGCYCAADYGGGSYVRFFAFNSTYYDMSKSDNLYGFVRLVQDL